MALSRNAGLPRAHSMNPRWSPSTFLGQLPAETLDHLLHLGTLTAYPAHRFLLHQGDKSRHVLLITEGVVKVVTSSEDGCDMLLAVRVAGDLVGEMAAFENQPRSGTVIACSDVSAHIIQWRALEGFLTRHADAMAALFQMMSARLRWANRRRLDFRAYDAPTRLARVIAELAQAYGHPHNGDSDKSVTLGVTLTQTELASLAGLALPTAEKALATLSQQGLLERNYRRITISDIPQLLKFARIEDENPY
ncbi:MULTISPECIES: Crp/Fnr family transcriptional regulator [Streptomyces]|uniref:Crp/Fnr family transcriptional regulator n=1 Tax=Streptomyces TaxID=1883 RepID=UPI000ACEFD30|nr:Crp/Fnr family transcriptional regulator [Streptomyces sp. SID7805]